MVTDDTRTTPTEHGGSVAHSGFDLSTTHVHLGLGSRAVPIPDFEWTRDFLARYGAEHGADGDEGRLVMIGTGDSSWAVWERHPAGEEVVVVIAGQMTLVQERDGIEHRVDLTEGQAAINPRNVWHTADIAQPCRMLFITPGRGTEHRHR